MDFIKERGRVAARSEYAGLDASSIPALFAEYFEGLSETEKAKMAQAIAAGALGASEILRPYVATARRLMGDLCMRRHGEFFQGSGEVLEKVFTDAANLKAWLEAPDPEREVQGPAFKKEWRYALALLGVLHLLGSKKISQTYQTLLENAQSEHFRYSLLRTRDIYEHLLKSR